MSDDDVKRAELVAHAQRGLNQLRLPAGYNAVVVVTDEEGAWCGVSSTSGDEYAARLLAAALNGAEFRRHIAPEPIDVTCEAPEREPEPKPTEGK